MDKKFIRFCAIWLIIAHLQLAISPTIYKIDRKYASEFINPFLSKSYHFPSYNDSPPGKIMRVWWIKYVCNDLYRVMIFFVLTAIALRVSWLLARVAGIFFLYTVVDHVLLWVNYRSSSWQYLVINIAMVLAAISLFLPEKKRAIVRSMD